MSVGNPLAVDQLLFNVRESAQERDPINVRNVVKLSIGGHILTGMRESTQERDRMNVRNVGKPSAR